ncbi:hypothetical protein B0H14DRAFT_3426064 [Mycena olivaceomarginata]|nr:hypothetical protein B0H14DRAFT_3426064 [Mycena olivaceomarginata]
MSLVGLRASVKHCPDLASLSITFDASRIPPCVDSPETIISQISFPYLDINASPTSDSAPVVQFMSRIFPILVTIRASSFATADEAAAAHDTEKTQP